MLTQILIPHPMLTQILIRRPMLTQTLILQIPIHSPQALIITGHISLSQILMQTTMEIRLVRQIHFVASLIAAH